MCELLHNYWFSPNFMLAFFHTSLPLYINDDATGNEGSMQLNLSHAATTLHQAGYALVQWDWSGGERLVARLLKAMHLMTNTLIYI